MEARAQFNRGEVVYLHHVVAVAFPELPTINAARKALRQGRVLLDGRERCRDALAPSAGSRLTARLGRVDAFIPEVDAVLSSFNEKSERLEARCLDAPSHLSFQVVQEAFRVLLPARNSLAAGESQVGLGSSVLALSVPGFSSLIWVIFPLFLLHEQNCKIVVTQTNAQKGQATRFSKLRKPALLSDIQSDKKKRMETQLKTQLQPRAGLPYRSRQFRAASI